MITIVDPVSTGRELSASFVERGVLPLHLYQRRCAPAFEADTHPHTLLVDDPREALGDLAARGVTAIVAGSHGAVDAADGLSHALGLPHHDAATAAARLDGQARTEALRAAGLPVAEGRTRGPLFVVNTVSAGGRHVLGDLQAVRVDRVAGGPVERHTVLIRRASEVHVAVVAHVSHCLDALGVREGPAHTAVRMTADGPRLVGFAPTLTPASQDPSLHRPALGYSHADLAAERFADPAAFALRFTDPYRPDASVATVPLFVPATGVVAARPGLTALRALPGFHRAEDLLEVGDPVHGNGPAGTVYLRHPDEAVLRRSLKQLHHLEERGQLYSLIPTPSRTCG
ncbi:hypothetical protein EV188_101187 [Actinomycetospora succinea]|uniref:ATP-grasp domain-containing protein n=1 Tax=Actinomycetospora succinea TaxID=663603 RepID=A0A4V3DB27_9PSEU|nr:hypothetical protein [Actinomycetospora succinea]TDQ64938.1 hypothetical protein EV188_101187 [Actinomycetospora succinea]